MEKHKLEISEAQEDMKDIKKIVERILKLLTAESDANSSELVSLVNDFSWRYQALYGHYDHLVSMLKKNIPHKRGEDGSFKFEFNSDSESLELGSNEISSEEAGADTVQEGKEEMETKMDFESTCLKHASEKIDQLVAILNPQLIATCKEKEAPRSVSTIILSKMRESEKALVDFIDKANNNLKMATKILSFLNEKLLSMNENLKHGLEVADQQGADLIHRYATAEEENKALIQRSLSQIQENEKIIKNLTAVFKLLKVELGVIQENNRLILEGSGATSDENRLIFEKISMLEQNQKDLQSKKSEMESRVEGERRQVSAILERLEKVQNETSGRIKAVILHTIDLQRELGSLRTQKSELEEQINESNTRYSEELILMKNSVDGLTSKHSYHETVMRDQENCCNELITNYRQLGDMYQESCMQLEDVCKELLEKLRLSETERAKLDEVIAKLNEQLQTLEVQLHQLKQKFEDTESENRETIENHKRTAEVLQEEQRKEFEERMLTSSTTMARSLERAKEAAMVGMETFTDSFRKLGLKVEERRGPIMERVSKCTEEVKMVKMLLQEKLVKTRELVEEKVGLEARLELEEVLKSKLIEEAEDRKARLGEKDKELEQLTATVAESKRMTSELQTRVKEKEDEVLVKDEEKREVIKQLCLLIEHYRDRWIQLSKDRMETRRK